MKKVILLRFGELYLKGKNKGYFEKALLHNIKQSLKEFECKVTKISGRYLVTDFDKMDSSSIILKLKKIFGLTSLSVADEIETSQCNIEEYLNNDCQIKDMYLERSNSFYKFNDRNNCKRVYDAIKRI